MINATLYKELSDASDIVEIQSGVTIAESFPSVDLSRMVIIVNGRESDQYHVVREGDVIILRSIPHALTTAALITLGVIVLGGAVYFGIEAYKARKQAEELEEKLKNLNDSVKNVPYLQGAGNSIALGKSQPYLIGEHLFTPYLMTGTFSKLSGTDGADQYFYAILENGFNSQVIRRLYCDDVLLKDWGDVLTTPQEGIYAFDATSVFYDANSLIEVAQDGNAFATVLFDKKISTESPGAQLKKADDDDYEDLVYTLPRYTRAAEVCIMINGLRAYNDSGSKINRTVTVIPEYQLVDGGAWTAFTFDQSGTPSNTFTRNIMTQLRFVARIDFTYAAVSSLTDPVKVRLRCTTNAYDGSASDDVYVQWVQSEIYDPIASATASAFVDEKIIGDTERALSTLIGLKIKVTTSNEDKLSKINCVSAGIARTWDGAEWSTAKAPTSNPAAWLLEVLTSPTHLASQCDDSEIDLDSFGELYEYCATNSLAVDMVLADGDTKESIITTILQTCFSMLYRDIYGKISVAIDEAKPNAIALFNTQNVTSFENEKSLARRADGIKVSYVSRDGGYVQSSYLIMRSGVTRSSDSIIRDVSVTGIVEYNHIVKYARRLMAIEALRPKTTTIGVGREGTYFTPLSKVLIQHPSLRVGLGSAEIKSVIDNGTHITGLVLYEPVTYDADDVNGYGVVIGCVGSDYYTPLAAAYTADSERPTEIEFVTPIILSAAAIPHPGDVLSYGTLVGGLFDLITTPMLIAGIAPTDEGFALTLVDYDENVYAVGDIPEYVPNFVGLKPTVSVPATVPPADKDAVAAAIAAVSGSLPPDNNVTTLTPSSSPNADGTVKVILMWAYTQGSNKADGAYIYCKAGLTDPAPIDFSADPAEYRPMSADGTYTWEKILPVRTGGAAGAPIKYRFGVVAAKGVMLHADGVVEVTTPVDWTKIEFTGAIQFDENNFWNLVSGAFKVSDSSGDELSLDPGNGITLKARLLQLETAMSRMYSTIEFYRDRLDYLSPSYGKQRVAIGEGALYFDKYTTEWQRNGGFHAVYGDVGIIGNLVKSLGTSSYSEKTRAQIASGQSIWNTAGCPADATHIIGAFVNATLSRLVVRVGTISGDAISWGAEQNAAVALYVTQPRVIFVTATRFVVVMSYPGYLSKIMYTHGTYSGGAITISTSNVKYLTVAGMHGNLVMSKTAVLGSCVGWCADTSTDPKTATLTKFSWNDSTLAFTQGDSATITDYAVDTYGDIDMLGDYLFVTMRAAAESRWRFSLFDPLTLAAVASDVLADSVVSDLTKVPGLVSGRMALLHSGSQYYLVQVDDPTAVMPTTVTVAPSFVVPDGIASRGVAFDGQDYYCTPFDTVEYAMARVGAGIIAYTAPNATFGNGLVVPLQYLEGATSNIQDQIDALPGAGLGVPTAAVDQTLNNTTTTAPTAPNVGQTKVVIWTRSSNGTTTIKAPATGTYLILFATGGSVSSASHTAGDPGSIVAGGATLGTLVYNTPDSTFTTYQKICFWRLA